MMTRNETCRTRQTARPLRTVALVGRYAHQHLQDPTNDYDVVFIESTTHAYSKIKHVLPDLVVICLSGDERDGCQVLSMLALDSQTARIPVLTFLMPAAGGGEKAAGAPEGFTYSGSISIN